MNIESTKAHKDDRRDMHSYSYGEGLRGNIIPRCCQLAPNGLRYDVNDVITIRRNGKPRRMLRTV